MIKDFEYPEYMFDKNDFLLISSFLREKKQMLDGKKLVVFGAGIRGSVFAKWLNYYGFSDYIYCDNNREKWGGSVGGHMIISPDELKAQCDNCIVLISVESGELVDEIEKQLLEINLKKGINLFSFPSKIYDNYLDLFFKPIKDHLLVLGDCRFTFVSFSDDNTDTLDDILEDRLKKENISAKILSMHALSMRAQYYVIKTQLSIGNKPKAILLPINYETYNGTMHLLSSSQHTELMRRIYDNAKSNDEGFAEYVKLTQERTTNPPFIFSMEQGAGSELVTDKKLKLFLKMSYMYVPDVEGEGIVYLIKALELAKKENIRVLTFVPPVNYMSGRDCWGDEFTKQYNAGIDVFGKLVMERGAAFFDQSYLLDENGFYSKYDKNEIANYEGRIKMAESLLRFIKDQGL